METPMAMETFRAHILCLFEVKLFHFCLFETAKKRPSENNLVNDEAQAEHVVRRLLQVLFILYKNLRRSVRKGEARLCISSFGL